MKFFLFWPLALVIILISCNDPNDPVLPASELANVELSLLSNPLEASVPEAMKNAEDPYAIVSATYAEQINFISSYATYFTPPANAAKQSRTTSIGPNGTSASLNYLVYTWSAEGIDYAYQISEQNYLNVFEIFMRESGQTAYTRFLVAEESKDGKTGQLILLLGTEGVLDWQWHKAANGSISFTFSQADQAGNDLSRQTCTINSDQSGWMEITQDEVKQLESQWDSQGNGSWKEYSEEGTLAEEGTWTI